MRFAKIQLSFVEVEISRQQLTTYLRRMLVATSSAISLIRR